MDNHTFSENAHIARTVEAMDKAHAAGQISDGIAGAFHNFVNLQSYILDNKDRSTK